MYHLKVVQGSYRAGVWRRIGEAITALRGRVGDETAH